MTERENGYLKIGNTAVSVVKGNITDQKVDVIVNSTTADLNFDNAGPISRAILRAAGNQIQTQCRIKYRSPINTGDVAVTGPGQLDMSYIFHVWIPSYQNPGDEKNINTTVIACLKEAEVLGLESIAFPALGTGGLNYEPYIVARTLYHAVYKFNKMNPQTNIRLVICVVFQDQMFHQFLEEARRRARQRANESVKIISTQPITAIVGNTKLHVFVGDLIMEKADVLVYTRHHNLQLRQTTGLAGKIQNAGGNSLQDEFDKYNQSGIENGKFVVTNGYGLKYRKVYHGCLISYSANGEKDRPLQMMSNFIIECLKEVNRYSCSSVAFPPLGTGKLKFPSDVAAYATINTVKTFLLNNPQTSIREVVIIIYGGKNDWSSIEKAFRLELTNLQGRTGRNQFRMAIPRRGTAKYFRFKSSEDPTPPTNWSVYTCAKTIKAWIATGKTSNVTLQADSVTFKSVEKLFMNTIQINGAQVLSIHRNENVVLYEKYVQDCQRIYARAIANGPCKALANTPGSRGSALTMQYLDRQMAKHLDTTINEVYLFHGTKRDRVTVLLQNGFDQRLSEMNFAVLRLGAGIYTAEDASLSARYTDRQGNCFMFLMRVCLGDVFTTRQNNNALKRPPCKAMCNGICVNHNEFFDSVVGEFNPREFVVYDGAKCYPEYLIKYKVVKQPQQGQ